jgi:hypothetical protein
VDAARNHQPLRLLGDHELREQLGGIRVARAPDDRRRRYDDERALARIDKPLVGHVLAVVEAARVGALGADQALALLHRAEHLLVALHDHRVVGAQALVELPTQLARQHADHDQLDGGERRVRHHHTALVFRIHQVRPGFGYVRRRDLVGAHRDADDLDAVGDPSAVAILGVFDDLVEAVRPERLERTELGEPVGGAGIRHRHDVGARAAGAHLLLQPAQHRLAAGAQHLHLDAGLLLEPVGELLGERDRGRGVPAQRPFPARRRPIHPIGREGRGRRERRGRKAAGGDQRLASAHPHPFGPPAKECFHFVNRRATVPC